MNARTIWTLSAAILMAIGTSKAGAVIIASSGFNDASGINNCRSWGLNATSPHNASAALHLVAFGCIGLTEFMPQLLDGNDISIIRVDHKPLQHASRPHGHVA